MAEGGNLGLGWHGAEGAGLAGRHDVALARVGTREHTRQVRSQSMVSGGDGKAAVVLTAERACDGGRGSLGRRFQEKNNERFGKKHGGKWWRVPTHGTAVVSDTHGGVSVC